MESLYLKDGAISREDRNTLKRIDQSKSIIVFGLTGLEIEFGPDMFDDF